MPVKAVRTQEAEMSEQCMNSNSESSSTPTSLDFRIGLNATLTLMLSPRNIYASEKLCLKKSCSFLFLAEREIS